MPEEVQEVNPDDFANEVIEQFSSGGDAPGATDPEQESQAGDATTLPEEPPEELDILGRKLAKAEAEALVEFYDWVRANPDQARAIDGYLRGELDVVPKTQPQTQPTKPETPEEDPYEEVDPAVRAKLKELDDLQQRVAAITQDQQQRQLVTAQTAVMSGASNFQERHGLTDEDMKVLMGETAKLGILPSLAQQKGDMVGAVEEALDVAYWRTPRFRERAISQMQQQQDTDRKRQKKASSLSGSSGSVPRTQSEPATPQARKEAMVAEIRSAMTGEGE